MARGAVSAASMITLYESVYAVRIMDDYSTSDVPRLSVLVASFALDVRISEEWLFFRFSTCSVRYPFFNWR